jgi:hypothetical protein
MKKALIISATLVWAVSAFAQGQVQFNNRVTSGTVGLVLAPIFGPEVGDPFLAKSGNTATGNPVGMQTYTGPPLAGTGFTAQLWAGPVGALEANLKLCTNGTASFRTATTGTLGGTINNAPTANVPDVPGGSGSRAVFQVRVWDNRGGAITSWEQVLADDTILRGTSQLFTPPFDLGVAGGAPPPALQGLQSFNLFQVPEPSVVALGVLGVGALVLLRRRSK